MMTEETSIFEKLDIKVKKSWRIARSIFFGCMLIAFIAAYFALNWFDADDSVIRIVLIVQVVCLALCVLNITIIANIQYNRWGYYIGSDKVEIKKGLIFLTTQTIPIIRLQNITKSNGPIDRSLGLSTVKMDTASGSFHIVGVEERKASMISEHLKDKLINRLQEEIY